MIVFRIGKTRYASDISGEGARLFGGRWNHKLTPCIYTSESRALALLEYTVNVNVDEIPPALGFIIFEVSDINLVEFEEAELPGNWRQVPAPPDTKDFGTDLLKRLKAPVFKIPSIIVPAEYNYILNPLHPDSKNFKIIGIKDFIFDARIKK